MKTRLLLISDIHGNYPALEALEHAVSPTGFDRVINCGDSLVYAPFPNQTMHWLRRFQALSILGNTDRKVIKLLLGNNFKKPSKEEKRVMYTTTAGQLEPTNRLQLLSLPKSRALLLPGPTEDLPVKLGIFHGSPEDPDEFLFDDTPDARFLELARNTDCVIVVTGHSHTPYHREHGGVHFINPGSLGRMFDGDPRGSYATIEIVDGNIEVRHFRLSYDIAKTVDELRLQELPSIYATMFEQGQKLN